MEINCISNELNEEFIKEMTILKLERNYGFIEGEEFKEAVIALGLKYGFSDYAELLSFTAFKVIVNRIDYEMTKSGNMLDVQDIIETLSVKLIGVVPDDKNVTISTNKGEPIVLEENSYAGQAFKNIARRIVGEEVPFMDLSTENEGFFNAIKKFFKKSRTNIIIIINYI